MTPDLLYTFLVFTFLSGVVVILAELVKDI